MTLTSALIQRFRLLKALLRTSKYQRRFGRVWPDLDRQEELIDEMIRELEKDGLAQWTKDRGVDTAELETLRR
jgi:Mn-dependent DtxR family transcriptional regulator